MTVWLYVKEGRLSLPRRFVQYGPQRLWLWNAKEYEEAVNIAARRSCARGRGREFAG